MVAGTKSFLVLLLCAACDSSRLGLGRPSFLKRRASSTYANNSLLRRAVFGVRGGESNDGPCIGIDLGEEFSNGNCGMTMSMTHQCRSQVMLRHFTYDPTNTNSSPKRTTLFSTQERLTPAWQSGATHAWKFAPTNWATASHPAMSPSLPPERPPG